ncbi:MAG: hypothetical protein ACFBZ9_01280 [Sphingomonadales bacterium]
MASLADALPEKIKWAQEQVLPAYQLIGAAGEPAIQLVIRPAINEGIDALASGDVVRMIAAYKALDDIKL